MRLSQQQINAFIAAITDFLNTKEHIELRLFGSRTDDSLKGGDIDLLIITENNETSKHLQQNKPNILGKIFTYIEEEKIDITIISKEQIQENSFIESVYPTSLLVYEWVNDDRLSSGQTQLK